MSMICVASPKGGVGKTMLTANIAHGLQRAGHRVLAIDLDPQNALRLHFGVPLEDEGGFAADLLRGDDWRVALRRTASGVLLLPHGALDHSARLALAQRLEANAGPLDAVLREAASDPGQIVVVDTAPGASRALSVALPLADAIVVPLLADGGSVATLPEIESGRFFARGTMGGMLAARARIVVNGVDESSRLSCAVATSLLRHLGPRLLGLVARDEAVADALAHEALLADHAPGSRAALDIAEIVRALDAPLPVPMRPAAGLLSGAAR
jgi:cellulose synthase operon protein YhjQ